MIHFKFNSIAIFLALFSLETYNLIGATWTHSESATVIVEQSNLIKDTIHHVGDLFGGGVIFFVDKTGQHGLICSISDIRDSKSINQFSKQDPTKLKGRKDSAVLINQVFAVSKPERAEELCNNYTNSNYGTGVFSDWYLPTIDQLEIMFKVKEAINKALENFNNDIIDPLNKIYWSASKTYNESMGSNWIFDFNNAARGTTNLPLVFIRAVRAY